jgi:hypothetical protein
MIILKKPKIKLKFKKAIIYQITYKIATKSKTIIGMIKYLNKKHSKIIFNKHNLLFNYFYSKKIS